MKKNGILNSEIAKVLADLRHTDYIVIGDAGLPVPEGVKQIDLALVLGTPSFMQVLQVIHSEMVVEACVVASEIKKDNPQILAGINGLYPDIELEDVSHEEFKELTKKAKVIIRTGEATPYANIMLQSACLF